MENVAIRFNRLGIFDCMTAFTLKYSHYCLVWLNLLWSHTWVVSSIKARFYSCSKNELNMLCKGCLQDTTLSLAFTLTEILNYLVIIRLQIFIVDDRFSVSIVIFSCYLFSFYPVKYKQKGSLSCFVFAIFDNLKHHVFLISSYFAGWGDSTGFPFQNSRPSRTADYNANQRISKWNHICWGSHAWHY